MFAVSHHLLGSFQLIRLTNTSTGEYFEVLPSLGAGMNDLVIRNTTNNTLQSVIDGYRSSEEIRQTHHNAFKGNKLAPYPNRIKDGKYSFDGIEYQFPIHFPNENNSIHGLLHHRSFEVVAQEEYDDYAAVELKYEYNGTDQGYPFPFTLTVQVKCSEKKVTINTIISHEGDQPIPMADGWHPYFAPGGKADDWKLKFPEVALMPVDDQMIPTREVLAYEKFSSLERIGDTELDSCFKLTDEAREAHVQLQADGVDFNLSVTSGEKQYRYLQVYIPAHREAIAIEPMTCPPDFLNNIKAENLLQPREKLFMSFDLSW